MNVPRLRAPEEDGAVLAVPSLTDLADHVERNRSSLNTSTVRIGGMPLAELRRLAVRETTDAARTYLQQAGEQVPDGAADSLFMAGHQPDLFHPGVWLKNFALNALARRHGAAPLNLVVDNDTAKNTAIRLPVVGGRDDPAATHLATLSYDHFAGEVAFEEREVHDEAVFADFPRAVAERTSGWGFDPILPTYWDDVLRQRGRTRLVGERLAGARRGWERRWGCHNRELPISHLCRTAAFARFVVAILDGLAAFHSAYNDSVHDYRRRHRIRSANHPVPDLGRDGDWLEAPFWAWRNGGKRRGRLFARQIAGGWQLRAGDEPLPDVPRERAADRWRALEADGFKVRTRALTTTLFARLYLADLFIHGIGGGKYDELTDAIIARHFGIVPPSFLVLTGTLQLPLPRLPSTPDDERAARRLVRDIHWNPQRHLSSAGGPVGELVSARESAAHPPAGDGSRPERFVRLRHLTGRLRPWVAEKERVARSRAARIAAEAAANAVVQRRDYAFCLFPQAKLRPFLTGLTSACQPAC